MFLLELLAKKECSVFFSFFFCQYIKKHFNSENNDSNDDPLALALRFRSASQTLFASHLLPF